MSSAADPGINWQETHQSRTLALNVGGRYMVLTTELFLGLLMLPFNIHYLGAAEYGLWMLAASIVAYFPVLDLGYGGAMERFVAHYRAQRNVQALNEIASTAIIIFAGMGLLAFTVMAAIAWNLGAWFELEDLRARTGGIVMLLVAAQFAIGFPFGGFGAIVNGFQRQYLNASVGTAVSVSVAIVNVTVLLSGGGLVDLIAATTATRLVGYIAYRLNAYRVFPPLQVRVSLFRMERVREMTRFSTYMLLQDLSNRLNYATDPIVIAAVFSTGAVAVWTVAQRLADVVLQLTNQLNVVLFPVVVDCDSTQRDDRLRELLVQGTRFSLATTLPVAGSLALLANPVVIGWTGQEFSAAAAILQILAVAVVVRVGSSTSGTVLQGGGQHRLVAGSNFAAAAVNLILTVLLIRTYGLPGVAVATLVPVSIRAAVVLAPAACTRVKISYWQFLGAAVWPATWPAAIVLAGLASIRDTAGTSLGHAVVLGACVGLVYAALFLGVAIGRHERSRYLGKLRSIAGWPAVNPA